MGIITWIVFVVMVVALVAPRVRRRPVSLSLVPQPALFREVPCKEASETHHARATAALRGFAAAYQSSFEYGRDALPSMLESKSLATRHLGELRMRLPNDLAQERELAEFADRASRVMVEHIDEARARTKASRACPYPIDDVYYATVARAADVTAY